ncbi:hypothetical protein, partial [Flavobacterium psychrophilum]|uniref:hypothetical protein n=1 Tax=Flavobacterium psychrophilum TaxID=96345 RepID=UPI001C52E0B4
MNSKMLLTNGKILLLKGKKQILNSENKITNSKNNITDKWASANSGGCCTTCGFEFDYKIIIISC